LKNLYCEKIKNTFIDLKFIIKKKIILNPIKGLKLIIKFSAEEISPKEEIILDRSNP